MTQKMLGLTDVVYAAKEFEHWNGSVRYMKHGLDGWCVDMLMPTGEHHVLWIDESGKVVRWQRQ